MQLKGSFSAYETTILSQRWNFEWLFPLSQHLSTLQYKYEREKKERNKARVSTNATMSSYTTEYLKLSYISYHILTELAYKTSSNLVKGKIFELDQNKQ